MGWARGRWWPSDLGWTVRMGDEGFSFCDRVRRFFVSNNGFRVGLVIGFWTLPCARVVCGFHSRRWFFRGRSLQIYTCYLYVSSSPLINPTVYVMLSVLYMSRW